LDGDQSLNTLLGLETKLILKHSFDKGNRRVLIPKSGLGTSKTGCMVYNRSEHHVRVSIAPGSTTKPFSYMVDTEQGYLQDDGSTGSKLYLALLHALTSFCRPDPLTSVTGIEQALRILRSAAFRSFTTLTEDEIFCLQKLAKLAPARAYYPKTERGLQDVAWDPELSFLSQSSALFVTVQEIFEDARCQPGTSVHTVHCELYLT
jgi:hypothetical protein